MGDYLNIERIVRFDGQMRRCRYLSAALWPAILKFRLQTRSGP